MRRWARRCWCGRRCLSPFMAECVATIWPVVRRGRSRIIIDGLTLSLLDIAASARIEGEGLRLRVRRRTPFNFREPANPSPFAPCLAISTEPRRRGSRFRRSRCAAISGRQCVALEVPLRRASERHAGPGGERSDAGLRLPGATPGLALAAGFAVAQGRRGFRPADDRTLRRRRFVGLPLRMRRGSERERRASAPGSGAFVRPLLWRFERLSGKRPCVDQTASSTHAAARVCSQSASASSRIGLA